MFTPQTRVHVTEGEDGYWEAHLFHRERVVHILAGVGEQAKGHDAQSRVWAGELIWESSAEQQPTQPCELMRPSRA